MRNLNFSYEFSAHQAPSDPHWQPNILWQQVARRSPRVAVGPATDKIAQLHKINAKLRRDLAAAKRDAAAAQERLQRRLAADLHDGPAQLVGLALLYLDGLAPGSAADAAAREQATVSFDRVRGALADAMREIRDLAVGAAPPDLEAKSLADVIAAAAHAHARRTGTQAELQLDGLAPALDVPAAVATCVYRMLQEGLHNAFKHAGGADVRIVAENAGATLRVAVHDAGPGFCLDGSSEPEGRASRLGLAGLRGRIEALGGLFEIVTGAGAGTRLVACFKLDDFGVANG